MQISTIGLDIAKNVFQVLGIDATEKVVVRKQLRRGQVIAFFRAVAPSCRHGSLRHVALSGARVDEVRSSGPSDAGEATCDCLSRPRDRAALGIATVGA